MEKEKIILTEEGLKKFEEELYHLKNVERLKVREEIKEAKAQGDLSENADYDAARDRQAEIESRIQYLENLITHATIIRNDLTSDTVSVGCTVELLSLDENEHDVYTIVGSAEADPVNGKISNESPLGSAIVNHKVGDKVYVKSESGEEFWVMIHEISSQEIAE